MAAAKEATTKKRGDAWETAMPLLEAMFTEFKELGKKKPDAGVSTVKISVVNRILVACREVLEGQPSLLFLDLIEEDNVPQMSDVVLTLSQYVAAMKKFQSTHYGYDALAGEHRWKIQK